VPSVPAWAGAVANAAMPITPAAAVVRTNFLSMCRLLFDIVVRRAQWPNVADLASVCIKT
jgi:hypothetical protein